MTEPDLTEDEIQLLAQGHVPELPRQFSLFSTLAVAFSTTNSWIGYSAVLFTPLIAGGGPTTLFGLVTASVACLFITLGLAELASAFPSSGGQYHFAFMVSHPSNRAAIAFTVGWLSVIAWCLNTAAACIFCAQVTAVLVSFFHPDLIWTRWQVYFIYALLCCLAASIIILLPRMIPRAEMAFFLASVIGFVVSFTTLLAVSNSKQSATTVFTDFVNRTGWDDSTAFVLGVGTCMYAFLSTDAATHIAEELPSPGVTVPRVMCLTMAIGALTAIPWTIALLFSTNDLNEVAGSNVPILSVYYQALSSRRYAAFFMVWMLLLFYAGTITCLLTAGRLTWAFARDNGLPCSAFFAKTHPTLKVPVNATLAAAVFCILYGMIYVASTTAFNSFVSLTILGLNITYMIPQAIVVWRGRDKVLPKRYFDLGPRFGPFCNIFSIVWVSIYAVLFCFPIILPVTLANMNYLSIVAAGVCLIILLTWWGGKRKTFVGPPIDVDIVKVLDHAAQSKVQYGTFGNPSTGIVT